MPDPLNQLPGYALRRASVAVMGELTERLQPFGLRFTESTVLMLIAANPGIRQSDLVRLLDIQRANMTPLVARLEERGLVERTPVDGRSWGLALSPEGVKLHAQLSAAIHAFEDDLIARVPEAYRDGLLPALTALWSR
jgi:DNA-binding MarR family transcriptional regulator